MMRRHVSGWLLATWMTALCGCQSWSQLGQGVPGGSRVPPPGTGTYQVPSSYYNNGAGAKAGAVSSNGQTAAPAGTDARTASTQGSPSTGVTTANWQVPTVDQMRSGINSTAAAALDNANNRANQVVQAGTSRAAAAVEKVADPLLAATAPPTGSPSNIPASRSLSDKPTSPTDEPQLDWQPPQ